MRSTPCDRRGERGFTLVEVAVATLILLVGILATAAMLNASSRANSTNRQRDAATNIARELIESARAIPYDRVSEPGVNAFLQAVPGLEDSPGGGYTLVRNNVSYTIDIDVCIMDDAKDGGGPRSTSETFCATSVAAGTTDKNPEDYKRVTTTVTWTREGVDRQVQQTGIINNPGSASGPAIRSIAPVGGTTVVSPLATQVVVDVTTSSAPAAINWLLDGSVQQPPPTQQGTSGLNWRFTWNIGGTETGTLDGPYILSAEAFNQYGVSGPGRQETVILNRRKPFKPRRVTGGRTIFNTVEIEWDANSERDIIGYEVRRLDATGPTVVCALVDQGLETSCTDPTPPGTDPLIYKVYAYDRDTAGVPREGDESDPRIVLAGNQPPNVPTDLIATRNADDSVTLTWSRPSPEDPDGPTDGVDFYRIYRDGTALSNRVDRWFDDRPSVTWQDTDTNGLQHQYWVTAVDEQHMESTFLGPVTG
jgi:prepilin-type N-terminal cleavage/methylation domain-containing protein